MTTQQPNAPLRTTMRYVTVIVSSLGAGAIALGYMGKDDVDKVVAGVQNAGEALMALMAAITFITATVTTAWGAWKSSRAQQVARLETTPGVIAVVTNKEIAPAAFVEAAEDKTNAKVEFRRGQ